MSIGAKITSDPVPAEMCYTITVTWVFNRSPRELFTYEGIYNPTVGNVHRKKYNPYPKWKSVPVVLIPLFFLYGKWSCTVFSSRERVQYNPAFNLAITQLIYLLRRFVKLKTPNISILIPPLRSKLLLWSLVMLHCFHSPWIRAINPENPD